MMLRSFSVVLPALAVGLGSALLTGCSNAHDRYGTPPRAYEARLLEEFSAADRDGNEQISPEEFRAGWPAQDVTFETLDTDGNGSLSLAELRAYAEWRRIANAPPGRRQN